METNYDEDEEGAWPSQLLTGNGSYVKNEDWGWIRRHTTRRYRAIRQIIGMGTVKLGVNLWQGNDLALIQLTGKYVLQ